MRRSTILHPIAVSLSQSAWNEEAIRQRLGERLPRQLTRLAAPLAKRLRQRFPLGAAPDANQILRWLGEQTETERPFTFARRYNLQPAAVLSQPGFHPDPALSDLSLPQLTTPAELAEWLAITPDHLVRFADLRGLSARSDDPFGPHYRHHLHPKKNGSLRLIEEPRPFLKKLQRRILHGLLAHVPVHPAAMGFCPGRNCIKAAASQAGEALVISFDLSDFFPGIGMARLYGLFRAFGYPEAVARDLAGLTSAITPDAILKTENLAARHHLSTRHLPQGAPTSPALANASAYRLDCRLSGLARRLGATYTRYADDLTFSGDPHIRNVLLDAVPAIVTDEGFNLNLGKTRVMPRHQQQKVTGMVVNAKANIDRRDYDRLKATLHHLTRPEDTRRRDPVFLNRLSGQIAWVEAVNPARGHKLRERLNAILTTT